MNIIYIYIHNQKSLLTELLNFYSVCEKRRCDDNNYNGNNVYVEQGMPLGLCYYNNDVNACT
jgi:hypothetical protein